MLYWVLRPHTTHHTTPDLRTNYMSDCQREKFALTTFSFHPSSEFIRLKIPPEMFWLILLHLLCSSKYRDLFCSFRQICSAVSTIHDIASGNYQPPPASEKAGSGQPLMLLLTEVRDRLQNNPAGSLAEQENWGSVAAQVNFPSPFIQNRNWEN